jgi:hypothetical protein
MYEEKMYHNQNCTLYSAYDVLVVMASVVQFMSWLGLVLCKSGVETPLFIT